MKKTTILLLLVFSAITTLSAQKGLNFLKFHAGAELTTGHFAEGYNSGIGIYVTDYIGVEKNGSFVLSTGFATWNLKNENSSAAMSLTRVGYRHFIQSGLYFQGDAGLGIGLKNFSPVKRFCFGGGLGYLINGRAKNGLDISLRVNRGFIRTWFGIALGYQFKL